MKKTILFVFAISLSFANGYNQQITDAILSPHKNGQFRHDDSMVSWVKREESNKRCIDVSIDSKPSSYACLPLIMKVDMAYLKTIDKNASGDLSESIEIAKATKMTEEAFKAYILLKKKLEFYEQQNDELIGLNSGNVTSNSFLEKMVVESATTALKEIGNIVQHNIKQGHQLMSNKSTQIQIRTTQDVKEKLIKKAEENGFSSLSEYLLFVGQNAEIKVSAKKK